MVTEAKKLVKLDIPKKLGVWKTTKVAAKKSPVKPILYYVGLEALEARYTLQLTEWNTRVFKDMAVNYHVVKGHELDARKAIDVGQVLDAFGRPFYALQQIQSIITLIRNGSIKKNDILFFEDMFHPGFEALPYIFNQLGWRPKIFVRCLAQSIDPDDFVHVTGMTDAVLIASHEMAACATTAGWKVPLIVTGLPFGKDEVRERAGEVPSFDKRPLKVVFAARTDQEKLPTFFLDLAASVRARYPQTPVEFAILSGGAKLKSNNPEVQASLEKAVKNGDVTFYGGLKKEEYYAHLKNSRVLFNCALQDWVSNTVSEADALGTNVLYPAYRSFPEVFGSDHTRLYVPWSLRDAENKLMRLLMRKHPHQGRIADWQDGTVKRSVLAMLNWNTTNPLKVGYIQCLTPIIIPQQTVYRSECSLDDINYTGLPEWWEIHNASAFDLLKIQRKIK
jgi:hypothetical protein